MEKILITGVNGQIGRAIVELLVKEYEVIGTSIEKDNQTGSDIQYIQSDITDKNTLLELPKDIDAIVHCAAIISNDGLSNLLIDSNCKGVQNVADYALQTSCKEFVYFSSLPIIGKPRENPITEEHPVNNPPTVYHATKYFGELILKKLLNEISLSIFRIPSPIGKNTPANKIIPVFVKTAIENKDYTLLGSGGRIQNYIDVRDIARAVKCAIEKRGDGVFNIGSTRSYSNKEVAELCIKLFHSSSVIKYQGIDKEEDFKWFVSVEKARKNLGFEAKYSLEETLKLIGENYLR